MSLVLNALSFLPLALQSTFVDTSLSIAPLFPLLSQATEALQAILHAEHAFVFIMDSPRGELWMQCRPPGQDELLSVR